MVIDDELFERIRTIAEVWDRPLLHAIGVLVERGVRDVETTRVCRDCACTDNEACIADGMSCHWVDEDLCSECARRATVEPESAPNDQIGEKLAGKIERAAYWLRQIDGALPPGVALRFLDDSLRSLRGVRRSIAKLSKQPKMREGRD